MPSFREGQTSLRAPEIALLGDISGKTLLHLQCHFGQDTLSLARMGAEVTGIDFSDKAISSAQRIAGELNIPAKFVCCDIYSLPQHLEGQFDIVFTSYGTIGWLPDLEKWAAVVAHFLKPGGKFVMVDFHPVAWMFDDAFTAPSYGYFNTGPIIEQEHGTYADKSADIHHEYHGWNHSMAELIGSLLAKGLTLKGFQEYDYSAYDIFANSEQVGEHQFQLKDHKGKLPLMYSLLLEK